MYISDCGGKSFIDAMDFNFIVQIGYHGVDFLFGGAFLETKQRI